jgi:hypothetical protein
MDRKASALPITLDNTYSIVILILRLFLPSFSAFASWRMADSDGQAPVVEQSTLRDKQS